MITLIAAQSIDGFIARHDVPGTDFCSEEDSQFLRQALREFDSLIMGRKTYDTLRDRILKSDTKRFLRKIVTRSPDLHADDHRPDLIEFTSQSPGEIRTELKSRNRQKTALLGGGEIYTRFLEAGVVDEIWLTVEPILFGKGTPLISRHLESRVTLFSVSQLGENSVLLKYKPQ